MIDENKCSGIHTAPDKCSYARTYCVEEQSSLIPYVTTFYCAFPSSPVAAPFLVLIWLAFLFMLMAKAASDFCSENLQTIVKMFGISQALAGVTLFAFGNGSSDLFSTFAAVRSGSGSLAVGELFGAATFISAVVAGSMAIAMPFQVPKGTFLRDVGFFLCAEALTFGIVADGTISFIECSMMIAFYGLYVVTVLLWHWYAARKSAVARANAIGSEYDDEATEQEFLGALQDGHLDQERYANASLDETVPLLSPGDDESSSYTQMPSADTNEGLEAIQSIPRSSGVLNILPSRADLTSMLAPGYHHSRGTDWWSSLLGGFAIPVDVILALTIPKVEIRENLSESSQHQNTVTESDSAAQQVNPAYKWPRWLLFIHNFTSPFFLGFNILANLEDGLNRTSMIRLLLCSLLVSLLGLLVLLFLTTNHHIPRYYNALSIVGFFVSVAWISLAANEIVGVMETLGLVLGISHAVLGFTVFAVGNSLNDLFANLAVARAGMPVMSLGACFGGPMFNTLLGIGFGVGYDIAAHSRTGANYDVYRIDVPVSLIVSGSIILLLLTGLLVIVPLNKWYMNGRVGWCLVLVWITGTVCNIVLQATVMRGD